MTGCTRNTQLHARRAENLPLAGERGAIRAAVLAYADGDGFSMAGLVYTPTECMVVRADATSVARRIVTVDADGGPAVREAPADLRGAFQARFFCSTGELRWVHSAGGLGVAVLVSEQPVAGTSGPLGDFAELAARDGLEAIDDHRYLVWGQTTGAVCGRWSELYEARIGSIWVPFTIEWEAASAREAPRSRVQIQAREYIGVEPRHGNAFIAEELLVGFTRHQDATTGGANGGRHGK